jgi:hypothetical protein
MKILAPSWHHPLTYRVPVRGGNGSEASGGPHNSISCVVMQLSRKTGRIVREVWAESLDFDEEPDAPPSVAHSATNLPMQHG